MTPHSAPPTSTHFPQPFPSLAPALTSTRGGGPGAGGGSVPLRSRREKEAEEQPGEGAHRKLIMLEGLDEEQDPTDRYDCFEQTISSLESLVLKLQTENSQVYNSLSQRDMENLDLTERNRVLQEELRDCQDELRESNRERVFLEGELKHFRSQPSQLRASSTTSSLLKKPSTITLRAHSESSKHIDGLPSSQSLPTSLNSPLAVRRLAPVTPLNVKLKQRSSALPLLSPLVSSRLSIASSTTPRSVLRSSNASPTQPSRAHLQLQSLAGSPRSSTSARFPSSPMINRTSREGGGDENDDLLGGESRRGVRRVLEAARREKERKAEESGAGSPWFRGGGGGGGGGASSSRSGLTSSSALALPPTPRRLPTSARSPLPSPFTPTFSQRQHQQHQPQYEHSFDFNSSSSSTVVPPASSLRRAQAQTHEIRQPLGTSNVNDSRHKNVEGVLMEKIKAVLSKQEVKEFRKLVTRFDSGEFKRDELVRRVQAVFCPNSKGASRVEWGERGRVWRMFEEHINIRKWE